MKVCKSCDMKYDQSEYEFCPYCGQVDEADSVATVEETPPMEVLKKEITTPEKKAKPGLKRLFLILIAVVAVAAIAYVVSTFISAGDPGVTVPDRYPTIQEAIDAASDGDEIVVQVGVYRENIDFKGKNITLRSTDPDNPAIVSETIIDGGGSGIVVSFRSGEGEGAVLSGLTITRGSGIVISGFSSPVIEKCIIEDNSAELGAGLYIVDSNAVIRNNMIIGNSGSLGGGIFIEEASPIIEGNTINGNRSNMGSGIAIIRNSQPTIINNLITDNYAANLGGGILVAVESKPLIQGNVITGNQAEQRGGGLYVDESEPVIEGNTISWNQAANGGGIFIVNSAATAFLVNANDFEGNFAFNTGGGILMRNSLLLVENNSFTGNESNVSGGAMAVYSSSPVVRRNTFDSNETSEAGRGGAIWYSADSVLDIGDPDNNTYLANSPDDLFSE